jgi:hypothetical protein
MRNLQAQIDAHAHRWIEIGLRTGPADRAVFEAAARRCYELANVPWHNRVVWVSSPLVLALAAEAAASLSQKSRRLTAPSAAHDAIRSAVCTAVTLAVWRKAGPRIYLAPPYVDLDDDVLLFEDGKKAGSGPLAWTLSDVVRGAVYDAVAEPVAAAVRGAAAGETLSAAVLGAVVHAVRAAIGRPRHDRAVNQAIADAIPASNFGFFGGQLCVHDHYAYSGPAYTSFYREICGLKLRGDLWDRARAYELTAQSACWWCPHHDFLMVCERPCEIHRELTDPGVSRGRNSHRLHCIDGAAVSWPDGWGIHVVHGVPVGVVQRVPDSEQEGTPQFGA